MEPLVVSLETAKKLKAAGFETKTLFSWFQVNDHFGNDPWVIKQLSATTRSIAAPTAQEIADQLPLHDCCKYGDKVFIAELYNADISSGEASTMAEALAALHLKLQEANHE